MEKFPRSLGKIPALEGDKIKLTEVPAIAHVRITAEGILPRSTFLKLAQYLAKVKPGRLLGDGSLEQEAEVMSWVNWANQEMLMIMSKWYESILTPLSSVYAHAHVIFWTISHVC